MSTVIAKNEYVDYDGKAKVSLDKLFITIHYGPDSKLQDVSLDKLFVKENKKARQIKSYADFVKQSKNNNVFTSDNLRQSIRYGLSDEIKVKVRGIHVPNNFDSTIIDKENATSEEKVPFGLRRNLEVKVADSSVHKDDKYYFVEIDGKNDFLKLSSIYFYDKTNKKRLLSEYKGNIDELTDVQLYAENGSKISMLYTEKQYVFPKVNAKETIDFIKQEKTTYEQTEKKDKNGNISIEFKPLTQQVDKYFSEQKYVRKMVDDEKKPGETKEVSLIQIRNFEYQPDGEYCQVVVDGHRKMIKLDNIVDESGNKVQDLRKMIGKPVSIKEGGKIIAKTEPLTYEQAHMAYSTIKTYQETDSKANESTYLRLKNGEYVKEVETVKPISFKVVNLDNQPFDAYLVKTTDADGKEKFEIVSKEYFNKHGDTTKYKSLNAIKIQRCDFNSKDCAVVQTTSSGEEIEQCALVKELKFATAEIDAQAKDTAYKGFMAGYLKGAYQVKDVYHNGALQELSPRRQRYEHTDISYLPDYADSMHQYKSLKNEEMKIINGKIVGGPKFSIGKGIKNSYTTLFRSFGAAYLPIMIGSVLTATIGGPIFAAAVVGAAVAAIPAIPIANVIYGTIKNHTRTKFENKEEKNRKANLKELEKRIKKLYERQTSKDYMPFPEARFEDEYAKLVNDIIALSSCSVANELHFENGVAKITPENANAAKEYIAEFNNVTKMLEKSNKNLVSTKKDFEKLDDKIKQLEDEGKVVNPKLQKKYDEAKLKYETAKNANAALVSRKEALLNYQGNPHEMQAHAERDRLLKVASVMRTAVYFKTFKDNPLVQEALYGEKGLTDCSDLLTEQDLALGDKVLTQEEIDAYRKQYADRSMKMLDNMEMDFKNGLMVDGMGVGLSDEEISRTPEYVRGYQWAKVKQAIELVHNGLKQKQAEPLKEEPEVGDVNKNPDEEAKPPVKEKKVRNKNQAITSEHDVVLTLEEKEKNDLYKFIMSKLTRKNSKFEMTKEEAAQFIFEFTQKINAAHDEGVPAQTKFEKGSVEDVILKSAIKKMSNLITQNHEIS